MYKIKKLCIEGMNNSDCNIYEFKDLNYICGPNGSGKSTILKAIQLALLGYIPGINKTNASIFQHSNSDSMSVSVFLQDFETSESIKIKRTFRKSGNSVKETVDVDPTDIDVKTLFQKVELPIFNFNEFRYMPPNALKDWFINFLPKSDSELDWESVFKESLQSSSIFFPNAGDVVSEFIGKVDKNLSGVDQVRKLNATIKDDISACKLKISELQGAVSSLIWYKDVDDQESESNIRDLREIWTQRKAEAIAFQKSKKMQEDIEVELSNLEYNYTNVEEDPDYQQMRGVAERILNELLPICKREENELASHLSSVDEKLGRLKGLIDSGFECPYTASTCESLLSKSGAISTEYASVENSREEIMKRYKDLRAETYEFNRELQNLQSGMASRERSAMERASLENSKKRIQVSSEPVYTEEECDKMIKDIDDMLYKIACNDASRKKIELFSSQKAEQELRLEMLKIWEKLTSANGLQSKMSGDVFAEFGQDIQNILEDVLPEVSFEFCVEEKSRSFSFGWFTEKKDYIPFNQMSSGEQCICMLCMMAAIVKKSDSRLPLIVVDDMFDHLDHKNFLGVFEMLRRIENIQIIVAGVTYLPGVDADNINVMRTV